jgi:hypothetical protein
VGAGYRPQDPTRWRNTVTDLLFVDVELEPAFHLVRGPGYPVAVPTPDALQTYAAAAAAVAAAVDVELLPLRYFMPSCEGDPVGAQVDACITELATQLGRYVYRRSLEDDEIDAIVALENDAPVETRMRASVEALLSSPSFWVLDESGTADPNDPEVLVLGDHAIATRLAYFLWNTAPDLQLLNRADAGELSDPAVRLAEVDRMMADPRASRSIGDYWEWALDIVDLQSQFKVAPEYDDALALAMREEVRQFVADVVLTEGDWGSLLSATRSFQNANLAAAVYDGDIVGGSPSSTEHELVELDGERRPGLLTRAAVMTRWSDASSISLTPRGMLVAQRLLCVALPAAPDSVEPFDGEVFEGLTRREAVDHLPGLDMCAPCHLLMDPITPGFDHYDPIGRWQEELTAMGAPASSGGATFPVDSSGVLFLLDGTETSFADRDDLLDKLIASEHVHACLVRGQLGFALGRELDDADACTLEQLGQAFEASDGSLRQLFEDIVTSDAFVRTRP